MRQRWAAVLALLGLAACAELFGPRSWRVALQIVPEFDTADPYAVATAATADSLRIRVVQAAQDGAFTDTVARATVYIDPDSGTAGDTLTVTLLQPPQSFVIVLIAFRSSDGVALFSGVDTVLVSATTSEGGQEVSIPVTYIGPRASRLVLAPQDTAVVAGTGFPLRWATFDAADNLVDVEARFYLVNPADSAKLRVHRLKGVVTSSAGQTGPVLVYAHTPDTAASDTTSIFLMGPNAATRVAPGYANVAVGATVTLAVLDVGGNPLPPTSATWASRSPGVAAVNAAGDVAGVGPGTAVVLATATGFGDSALVTVPPATHVVLSTTSNARGFRDARVGDTVVVDVTADMQFTPTEKLGSYLDTLSWNPAVLQFVDVQVGPFGGLFTVNTADAAAGRIIISSANAQPGTAGTGAVVVARARFRALAAGGTQVVNRVGEMSAAETYTNLFGTNRVTVTNGYVTVR